MALCTPVTPSNTSSSTPVTPVRTPVTPKYNTPSPTQAELASSTRKTRSKTTFHHVDGDLGVHTVIPEKVFTDMIAQTACRAMHDDDFRGSDYSPVRQQACDGLLTNAMKPRHEGHYMWTTARCAKCGAQFFKDNGLGKRAILSHLPSVSDKTTGHREVNLRVFIGTIFADMSFDGYIRNQFINKLTIQSSKTFSNMRRIIFDAIEAIAEREMKKQMDLCVKRGGVVFEFDVGYTKRGWVATQGWAPIIDARSRRIVKIFIREKERKRAGKTVREGNHVAPSGAMEGGILLEFLRWLTENYPELMKRPETLRRGPPSDLGGALIDDNQAPSVDVPSPSSTTSTPCHSPVKKRSRRDLLEADSGGDAAARDATPDEVAQVVSETLAMSVTEFGSVATRILSEAGLDPAGLKPSDATAKNVQVDEVDGATGAAGAAGAAAEGKETTEEDEAADKGESTQEKEVAELVRHLQGLVMDKDSTNAKILRENDLYSWIVIFFDPGHSMKSLYKLLTKLFKTRKAYIGIAERIANSFMWLIKKAEEKFPGEPRKMRFWFDQEFSHTVQHYCEGVCHAECRQGTCPYREGGKAKPSDVRWLQHTDTAVIKALAVIVQMIIAKSAEFIHSFSTCLAESAHSWRIRWANKDVDYWATFRGRCYLTVLWHYYGPKAILTVFDELKLHMDPVQRTQIINYSNRYMASRKRDASTTVMKHKNMKKKERKQVRAEHREIHRESKAKYKSDKSLFTVDELGASMSKAPKAGKSKRLTRDEVQALYQNGDKRFLACKVCGKAYAKGYVKTHEANHSKTTAATSTGAQELQELDEQKNDSGNIIALPVIEGCEDPEIDISTSSISNKEEALAMTTQLKIVYKMYKKKKVRCDSLPRFSPFVPGPSIHPHCVVKHGVNRTKWLVRVEIPCKGSGAYGVSSIERTL